LRLSRESGHSADAASAVCARAPAEACCRVQVVLSHIENIVRRSLNCARRAVVLGPVSSVFVEAHALVAHCLEVRALLLSNLHDGVV
jgi:hypothetical protein